MKEEQISSGSIVTVQAASAGVGFLVLLGLGYLCVNVSLDGSAYITVLFIFAMLFLGIYQIFRFADVYKVGNKIICKRLFQSKERHINDIEYIEEGFSPLNYKLIFKDGLKVLFQISISELGKSMFNSKYDALGKLHDVFELRSFKA